MWISKRYETVMAILGLLCGGAGLYLILAVPTYSAYCTTYYCTHYSSYTVVQSAASVPSCPH